MTYLTTTLTDQKTNLSFQKTTVTASQDVTTSWVLVEGGQISYTPTSASAEVMVEFSTAYARKDADNSVMFRLQIGDSIATLGDIVTNNVDYHNDFGATTTLNNTSVSDVITLKYKLSGWSGEKILQVQCKTYLSHASFESRVNANRKSATDSDLLFNPIFIIYEV
jgi:hypothetical protein